MKDEDIIKKLGDRILKLNIADSFALIRQLFMNQFLQLIHVLWHDSLESNSSLPLNF